jgi:hypothetical protein
MSLIFKPAEYTDEQRAQRRERRHENMTERYQLEKQLNKQKLDLMQEEDVLRRIKQQSDAAILVIQIEINEIRDTKVAREREEKHYRDRIDQDRWAKLRREQQEKRQKEGDREVANTHQKQHMEKHTIQVSQQVEVQATYRVQQEKYAIRQREVECASQRQQSSSPPVDYTQHGPYTSSSSDCDHDDWWPEIRGRSACPACYESWAYLLECPGCATRACPKCQQAIRPAKRNITRLRQRDPPRVVPWTPYYNG